MTKKELINQIKQKRSFLCVGLDTDVNKIPPHLLNEEDPVFAFNKAVIDATKDVAVAYKPNLAFYEAEGTAGLDALKKTMDYIPENIFTIADAKRGDIGNTAEKYAQTFFELFDFDAVTLSPYMGKDSIKPFLNYKDKWAVVLALTSNPGAKDFQFLETPEGTLYQTVIKTMNETAGSDQLMYVVGATRGDEIRKVRKCAPDSFFLVPGVGKQGGSLREVADAAFTADCGLLVNSSRGIIYAGEGTDFHKAVREQAQLVQSEMEQILTERNFL